MLAVDYQFNFGLDQVLLNEELCGSKRMYLEI